MEFQDKNVETSLLNSIPGKSERYMFGVSICFLSVGYGLAQCPV